MIMTCYLQSINMFSYSITHNILSTGDATGSIKLLTTKICSKVLLLKVSLEGFSQNIYIVDFDTNL